MLSPPLLPVAQDKPSKEKLAILAQPLPVSSTIFLAYAFRLHVIREAVKAAASGLATVVCADDILTDLHLLDKIKEMMSAADLCIFDLTSHNVNVAVEYGLARGLSLSTVLLYNEDEQYRPQGHVPDIFSDLRGLDSVRYKTFDELSEKLRTKLPEALAQPRRRRVNADQRRPRLQMVLESRRNDDTAFLIGTISNAGSAPANRISYALAGYIDPAANHHAGTVRVGTLVPSEPPRDIRMRYDDTGMLRHSTGMEEMLVEFEDDDGQKYEQRGRFLAYQGLTRSFTFEGLGPPKPLDSFRLPHFGPENF